MSRKRRPVQWVAMMAAVVGIMASPLRAGDEEEQCPPCTKDALFDLAPPDITVMMVNDAAGQRRSPAGRALELMLQDADYLRETRSAWRALAAVLDWSGEEAFDHLLGQRIALVMRGVDKPDPQWVVLSEVTGATERRLRERLRPAPRGSVLGFPSLSVEGGRFELVVGPAGFGADVGGRDGGLPGAMIMLGPAGGKLIAELAPRMLVRPMPTPPPDPAGRKCDFVLMLRQSRSSDAGGGQNPFVLLTGTLEQGGWDVRLAASPGMVWGRPEGVERIQPWSAGAFRTIEKDALLAMMGVIGSTKLETISAVHALSSIIPVIPLSLEGDAFGQRAAFFIREEGGLPRVAREAETPSRTAITEGEPAGGATMLRERARTTAAPVEAVPLQVVAAHRFVPRRLSVGMAIEAADSQRMLIEGDRLIARLLGGLESGRAEQQTTPVQLVVSVPETAVRVLRLDERTPIYSLWAHGIERAFGEDPIVSWVTRSMPGVSPRLDGPAPGWWVAALSSTESPTVERDAAALAAGSGGAALPRLSIGMVRPAALERAISRLDPHFLAPMRGMKWIESLRWDAWQHDDGTVQATIRIRMLDAK